MKSVLRLLLVIAAVATALCQDENEPYFALSTQRTFPSNGKPSVEMSAWNVDTLEFRVYRIEDSLKFFQQIEDPHRFGGAAPQPPRTRTLIERIHSWKRSLRAGVRRELRAQFTERPSEHITLLKASEPVVAAGGKGTHFAEAPLLNPQQLVLTFDQPVHNHSRWDRETVPLAVHDKGVYLVEAVHKDLRAYTILIISDIVMLTKSAKGRLVNIVVDRVTGEPLRDAQIWTVTRDGHNDAVRTGPDGMAEIKLTAATPKDLRVVARRVGDVAVNTLADWSFAANRADWHGFFYTDRPVYRPGHTVHFKGVIRLRNADGYSVPAGKSIDVNIQDPEQKPVYQKKLTLSANGTVHDDFVLPASAALGNYFLEAKSGDDAFMSANFEVQDYKKPEYEVRVTPSKPRVIQGESVQAVIDARYYFGEPVNGGKVEWAVYRDRYWFPLWFDPEEIDVDTAPDASNSDDSGDQVAQEEGQLDSEGKLTIKFNTTASDHKNDSIYRIEARVTDEAKREIVGKGWVVAPYGSYALNATPDRYFYSPGGTAAVKVEARDYDLKPVRARVHVELLRWNWRDPDRSESKGSTDVQTGDDGTAVARLTLPPQGGSYRVKVSSHTPEGRDVEDFAYLWASGGGGSDFYTRGGEDSVQIIADKKNYQAGDTARLMIVTGRPNTPLYVSVEGHDVRRIELVRSKDATAVFEVPVMAADEPGITVAASFVRKGVYHAGQKYLRVPPASHQLNVKMATDKPQYLPGKTAEYTLDVTDTSGKPVPRAEFSLGVVDEAIYAIRPDTTQDILKFFFGHEYNVVFTDNSLLYYFNGEAGKRRMRLAELRPPSKLAQLKPERLVQPKIRKAFPDTAFWATDIVTDGNGHARAKVDFPDSLTTWRATARGATPDTKTGAAVMKTIVRKNLILRLAVPRFFVQGDEVVISALVHNYLTDPKTVKVSLDVEGLDVLDGVTRSVDVMSRGEMKLDWRVRAQQVRTAKITGKALTNEESDGLELELPVNVPGVRLAEARGGSIQPGGSAAFDLTFPANVAPGSRSLSVKVTPSIAGSLFGALEYLISYPYGCVEQTMSSFLPNIIVTQASRDLGIKMNTNDAALQEKIRAGLDRLYNFQHEDGGWGWWETDDSHPFMTAYVVAGLAQAKAAGVQVNDEAINKGADWLKQRFSQDKKLAGDLRAYMQYALTVAGKPDAAGLGDVYGRKSALSPYGLALVGLAFEQNKDGRAAEVAASLEHDAKQDDQQAWWPATRDELLDFSEDATPEATAFVVKLLSHQRKDSPLLPKAALWLMNHRNEGFWWNSTKQTAMVVYGLTDMLKYTGELNPNLNVTVTVNDRIMFSPKLDAGSATAELGPTLGESSLQPGVNHIRITASGQGRVYYSARAEYYSTDEKLQKTGTTSLNLLRDYFRLTPGKDGDKIVFDISALDGPVSSGDVIAVRLTLTGSEWKYLMIEDPIPAGTEFIERDNTYQLRNKPPWWAWFFSRRELHDDRMAIFQTWFPQGQQQYFYLLKVVNPGVFQVSPARVVPMYQTGVMATTERRKLEVK